MGKQEQKIMFCDINTLEPDAETCVMAMRAQLAAQQMAVFNNSFVESSGAMGGGSEASGCGGNGEEN